MLLVQEAADLNCQGVILLTSSSGNDLRAALPLFEKSLTKVLEAANELSANSASTRMPNNQDNNNFGNYQQESFDGTDPLSCCSFSPVTIQNLEDEHFAFYNRALIFDTPPTAFYSRNYLNNLSFIIRFYSTAILFNLALCKHLVIIKGIVKEKEGCLNKIFHLYDACSEFMLGLQSRTVDTTMILAGTLNNQYHILQCQLNPFVSSVKQRQILEQLSAVVVSLNADNFSDREDKKHFEKIALNIFMARAQRHSALPA